MAAKKDRRVKSATLFASLLDFSDVGDIAVFIDEEQLKLLDDHMDRLGYLDGRHMAEAFNLLRENDLIWFFVVNNYLLGREPIAFDLLYWNSEFYADAGRDAQLLSAQHVSPKRIEGAGGYHTGGCAD